MTAQVETILQSFDLLPDVEKRELASEIVRRTLKCDTPPLSDEEFVAIAENLFLDLDKSESDDA